MSWNGNISLWLLAMGAASIVVLLQLLKNHLLLIWKGRSFSAAPPLTKLRKWDILGVFQVLDIQRAMHEERVLEFLQESLENTEAALGRRVTTVTMNLLGRQSYLTINPKNVQAVLAHQFNDFGLGADRIGSFLPMLGPGIFASDGKTWEHSRAMLRPNFARQQVEDLSLEERHCQDLFAALPTSGTNGWTREFDLQPFFYKLTMDSATKFFFGESSYSLRSTDDSLEARFVEAFDRGQFFIGQRTSMGPYYWLKDSRTFRADCKIVHEWTDMCVQRALERYRLKKMNANTITEKKKYVFLDELVEQTQDPIELRSQLLNVLIAGRDTTAGLLSWVFYNLSRRPAEYTKLREAVLEHFGTYNSPQNITFVSMKNCKPLQNLLKETLRLHPGVPFNIRQALKDTTLPYGGGPNGDQPCFVPKNSQIFYSVYLIHRDPQLWGPDANEFIPDRWNDLKVGWEWLPFNGGPRICLGQQFSLTSAGYCVIRMLQRFDMLHTSDTRAAKVHVSLTAHSANGVHLKLHSAK